MKRLLRSAPVQAVLAWLVWLYVETIIATLRWTMVNRAPADLAMAAEGGLIAMFWHGRIAQAMACRPVLRAKPRAVLISLSRDGDFIARAAERLAIPTLRGSTGRADAGLAKGGVAALRAALSVIEAGGAMLLTPDGPRGPRHRLAPGAVQMARAADCPVFLMGLAASPSIALGGWDGGRLPLPFARAALVIDGPRHAPRAADAQSLRAEWEQGLRAAQAEAEQLLGAR